MGHISLLSSILLALIYTNSSVAKPNSVLNSRSLIVVHPTNYFADGEAKSRINTYVNKFLDDKKPVTVLVETKSIKIEISKSSKAIRDKPDQTQSSAENYLYFLRRIRETAMIVSDHGENQILLPDPNVTIIGGYFEACLRFALRSLIKRNINIYNELKMYIPLSAIYGKDSFMKKGGTLKAAVLASLKRSPPEGVSVSIYINNEVFLTRGEGPKKVNIFIEEVPIGKSPIMRF